MIIMAEVVLEAMPIPVLPLPQEACSSPGLIRSHLGLRCCDDKSGRFASDEGSQPSRKKHEFSGSSDNPIGFDVNRAGQMPSKGRCDLLVA